MKVIWKRPDGFLMSTPDDFTVLEMPSQSKLWLHKSDRDNFPFRISGGWQDEESSRKLNQLVNLLSKDDEKWLTWLKKDFSESNIPETENYLESLRKWLREVERGLKGDTWELEIMSEALKEIQKHVELMSREL